MKNYIQTRLNLFKNPKVVGDIISNLGLGILVNSLYTTSLTGINVVNIIDIIISIFLIVEGSMLKEKQ